MPSRGRLAGGLRLGVGGGNEIPGAFFRDLKVFHLAEITDKAAPRFFRGFDHDVDVC